MLSMCNTEEFNFDSRVQNLCSIPDEFEGEMRTGEVMDGEE
jgi:hypothetical protein